MDIEEAKEHILGLIRSSIEDGVWFDMTIRENIVTVKGVHIAIDLHQVPEWKVNADG